MKRLIDYVKSLFTRKAEKPVEPAAKPARKPRVKKDVAPCCGPKPTAPKKGINVPKKGK